MNERTKELAEQAGLDIDDSLAIEPEPTYYGTQSDFEKFAELVRADEREKVAQWMMDKGYATGHGDRIEDLLKEIEWQVAERERNACSKVVEDTLEPWLINEYIVKTTEAIRERGEK